MAQVSYTTNTSNDTVTLTVVSPGGSTVKASTQVPGSHKLIDPVAATKGQTVLSSSINTLSSNPDMTSKEAQSALTVIENRALEANATKGTNDGKGFGGDLSLVSVDGSTIRELPGSGTSLGDARGGIIGDDIIGSDNLGGDYESNDTKGYPSSNNWGSQIDTISGSDLSVYYLAELPLMEDVLDSTRPPDTWRKETIIIELDSTMSLSYSTLRSKYPVRQLGNANPVAYTYGKRTIAGHITFAVFTEDVLSRLRSQVKASFTRATAAIQKERNVYGRSESTSTSLDDINDKINEVEAYYSAALHIDKTQLLDSLPPFHLLVMGKNERGKFSKFMIRNVSIIDENQQQGTAYPHVMNKVTWAAEDILPMTQYDDRDKSFTTASVGSMAEQFQTAAFSLIGGLPNLTGSQLLNSIDNDLATEYN